MKKIVDFKDYKNRNSKGENNTDTEYEFNLEGLKNAIQEQIKSDQNLSHQLNEAIENDMDLVFPGAASIHRIELENFKSIGSRVSLDIKNLTLLFGPNSVGKSTVFESLNFLKKVLSMGLRDEAKDNNNIKNHINFFYGKNPEIPIKIKIEFFLDHSWDKVDYRYSNKLSEEALTQIDYYQTAGVELEILGGKSGVTIVGIKTFLDGQLLVKLNRLDNNKYWNIAELNFKNPYFILGWEVNEYFYNKLILGWSKEKLDEFCLHCQSEPDSIYKNLLSLTNCEANLQTNQFKFELPLLDNIPEFGKMLLCENNDMYMSSENSVSDIDDEMYLSGIFTRAITNILSSAYDSLDEYLHIGPMRVIPNYSTQNQLQSQASCQWYDGSQAWKELEDIDDYKEINKWLTKLGIEYSIDSDLYIRIKSMDEIVQKINENEDIKNWLTQQKSTRQVYLVDNKSGLRLSPSEVGTGISQILPILVAPSHNRLIAIEQPELHIHPKLQLDLADFFVDKIKNRDFIIETHSEHILLRILRRIRDKDYAGINKENVTVYYFSKQKDDTIVRKLNINDQGDFDDQWPDGFFDERDDEFL